MIVRRLGLIVLALSVLLGACAPASAPTPASTQTNAPPASTVAPTAEPALGAPTAEPTALATSAPPRTPVPLQEGSEGLPWWNNTVFYEVFVRSFADSTTGPLANDGIGDLQGLIEKLDYLQELGVTGIWLMPIMEAYSYHGYDATDYYSVERDYGTNEDFRRLVEEAHSRGIRVIIDLVLNHTSDQHPWFIDAKTRGSEYRDWYVWSDSDPGNPGPWGEQAWHPLGDQYYYGVFWGGMPDLNYNNPAVTEEMLKVTRYWLEEMGADGYRLDAIPYLIEKGPFLQNTEETHEWLSNFHRTVRDAKPDAFTVGEVWQPTNVIATYVPDQVDAAFMFDLAEGIIAGVNTRMRGPVTGRLQAILNSFPEGQFAPFLTNHDQNRVMNALGKQPDRAKVAATVLLSLPGVPFLYYGEEVGMTGVKPDEKIRTPMQWTAGPNAGFSTAKPWQPVNRDYAEANVETQSADPESLLNHYRKLIALRNEHPALRVGNTVLLEGEHRRVLAFLRQSEGQRLLVVINLEQEPVSDYAFSVASSELRGQLQATELLNAAQVDPPVVDAQGGFADYKPVAELAPRTGYVIQLGP
jgi:alpha-amylase